MLATSPSVISESWPHLTSFSNSRRMTRQTFESWVTFSIAYLRGKSFWLFMSLGLKSIQHFAHVPKASILIIAVLNC
jgi:hypothetical protein